MTDWNGDWADPGDVRDDPPEEAKCDLCGAVVKKADRTDYFQGLWVATTCHKCLPPADQP